MRDKKGNIVTDEFGKPIRIPLNIPVEMIDPDALDENGKLRDPAAFKAMVRGAVGEEGA